MTRSNLPDVCLKFLEKEELEKIIEKLGVETAEKVCYAINRAYWSNILAIN